MRLPDIDVHCRGRGSSAYTQGTIEKRLSALESARGDDVERERAYLLQLIEKGQRANDARGP